MYSQKAIEEGNELMTWAKEVVREQKKDCSNNKVVAYGLASSLIESAMLNHDKGGSRYNYLKEVLWYLYTLI